MLPVTFISTENLSSDGVLYEGIWVMQTCEDPLKVFALLMKKMPVLRKFKSAVQHCF